MSTANGDQKYRVHLAYYTLTLATFINLSQFKLHSENFFLIFGI